VPVAELIPLGTASAIPTRERHLSAFALRRDGRLLLFDCGEGTQYRLRDAGLSRAKLDAIFLTHFHGDHLYGLFGLLSTLALLERTAPLTIVSPTGLCEMLRALPGLAPDAHPFELRFVELNEGFGHAVVYETDAYTVEARPLDHRVFAAGYRYQEKARPGKIDGEGARAAGIREGWQYETLRRGEPVTLADGRVVRPEGLVGPARPGASFAYVLDTRPCRGGEKLAAGVDLLVHEATFTEAHRDRAYETGHSTAQQAATVARKAAAKRLLLTHFSSRYGELAPLVEEARGVFPHAEAAAELRAYTLTEAVSAAPSMPA